MMKLLLDVFIAITTVMPEIYWYKSFKVLVGSGSGPGVEGDVEIICNREGAKPPWKIVSSILDQTKLNKIAAFWAAITAALAVINVAAQHLITNATCT
uniref:hypothetical protein n=1 Tax=Polynucleobacter sp. TaxID=2029855 RepID=UPI004047C4A1